jgi:anti-sigma factor RsiW
MNVTHNVIHDLLPAYVSGEASADTVALVNEFLRLNPEFARTVEAMRANTLLELPIALQPTREKETLNMTRKLLWWRGTLMGLAIFLTLLPLSIGFDRNGITWKFLQEAPAHVTILVCMGALTCWAGFLYVQRRLQSTGL